MPQAKQIENNITIYSVQRSVSMNCYLLKKSCLVYYSKNNTYRTYSIMYFDGLGFTNFYTNFHNEVKRFENKENAIRIFRKNFKNKVYLLPAGASCSEFAISIANNIKNLRSISLTG
jgi:hypothetical protein